MSNIFLFSCLFNAHSLCFTTFYIYILYFTFFYVSYFSYEGMIDP